MAEYNEYDDRTIWCGNLTDQVTEAMLHELFLQAGPLEYVKLMRDRHTGTRCYAFIRYVNDISVPYAINLFRDTTLFSKTLIMRCRGRVAVLPPPIKGHGTRLSIFMQDPPPIDPQYAHLVETFSEETDVSQPRSSKDEPNQKDDMDSIPGTSRNYSYRGRESSHYRDNNRYQDHYGNWRDRRYNKRPFHSNRRY